MKHEALERAFAVLEATDVLVSFSGGKDSLICLDMAKRVAKRVECFFMELVPGLEVIDRKLAQAEQRYGVKVRRYPMWSRASFAINGVYCFHRSIRPVDINDVYAVARADAGIPLIVTGAKRGDSLWRRRTGAVKFAKDPSRLAAPLWDWSSRDVGAYMKTRGIAPPESDGRSASGIDLSRECVLWLYDKHPKDYERLVAQYPFAGAIVAHRKFYGAASSEAAVE